MFETRLKLWPLHIEKAEERRHFAYLTFVEFLLFLLLALVQWILIVVLSGFMDQKLVQENESTLLLVFFISMLFFLMFAVSNQIRLMSCINWVTTLLVIEGLILASGLLAARTDIMRLLIGFLFVSIIMVLATLTALFMSYDITQHASLLFLAEFCVFMLSIYVAMLHLILQLTWPFFLYAAVNVIMVLPFLVYHVQTILGNGEVRTSLQDDKFAALLLFHDFLALFMLTFYWRPTRGDNQ